MGLWVREWLTSHLHTCPCACAYSYHRSTRRVSRVSVPARRAIHTPPPHDSTVTAARTPCRARGWMDPKDGVACIVCTVVDAMSCPRRVLALFVGSPFFSFSFCFVISLFKHGSTVDIQYMHARHVCSADETSMSMRTLPPCASIFIHPVIRAQSYASSCSRTRDRHTHGTCIHVPDAFAHSPRTRTCTSTVTRTGACTITQSRRAIESIRHPHAHLFTQGGT